MIWDLETVRLGRARARARGTAGYRGGDWRLLPLLLGIGDLLALAIAIGLAGALRLRLDEYIPVTALGFADRHLVASVLVIPVLLLLFRLQGLYDLDRILAGSHEYALIAHAATYGVLIAIAVSYALGEAPVVSRSWLVLVWCFSTVAVSAGRFAARRIVRRLRRRGVFRTRVVIVGASSFGVAIAEQFVSARAEGIDLVGFLDEFIPLGQPLVDGIKVIGRPGDLISRPSTLTDVDEYILVPQALPHERFEEITALMGATGAPRVRMAVSTTHLLTHGVHVSERANLPLVTLRGARLAGIDAFLKRTLDLAGAALALLVLAPVLVIAFARAYAAGQRDLLYGIDVRGADARRITLWLFDRRLSAAIPLRGLLVLTEVLTGRMSLVGPRPLQWDEGGRHRPEWSPTAMKPGLTGPWRLSGPSTFPEEQAVHDLVYARNYTVWEDFRILWESVRRMNANGDAIVPLARWQDRPGAGNAAPMRTARSAAARAGWKVG